MSQPSYAPVEKCTKTVSDTVQIYHRLYEQQDDYKLISDLYGLIRLDECNSNNEGVTEEMLKRITRLTEIELPCLLEKGKLNKKSEFLPVFNECLKTIRADKKCRSILDNRVVLMVTFRVYCSKVIGLPVFFIEMMDLKNVVANTIANKIAKRNNVIDRRLYEPFFWVFGKMGCSEEETVKLLSGGISPLAMFYHFSTFCYLLNNDKEIYPESLSLVERFPDMIKKWGEAKRVFIEEPVTLCQLESAERFQKLIR